ncbi:MAG: hypothetical protein EBU90_20905 [Proteobacteria bacterium]|nr:hypothetical protein [Pseudomonadota bacterium]
MANPNILSTTSIKGGTAYVVPGTTSNVTSWTYDGAISLTGLTPAANTINHITSMVVTNITSSAVTATVAIGNNPTFANSNVISYAAYQVSVPSAASLVVVDKTTGFYVTENQSVAVVSGTANALTFMAAFEAIT